MSYLDELNSAQRRAVEHTEGPLLVIAGAGAGKTRVITYRILHLIHEGVAPENILAVTFTNKAAREMRERIDEILSREHFSQRAEGGRPFISTFHALGVHIIKENARRLELSRHFTIYDRSDSIRAVKEALKDAGYDVKTFEPKKILGAISKAKGRGESWSEFAATEERDYFSQIVADVWEKYERVLVREKALDFDDLLLKAMRLLRDDPEVRTRYQGIWHYLHVDEYQDTNRVQNEFIELLTGEAENICVVGDVDQTIYSWRGADIENLLAFERAHPGAEVVFLEENYRSTQTIIAASNDIIRKNIKRKDKNLFTKNPEGEQIALYSAYSEADEALYIVERASELIRDGVPASEIAVLYRANFQSRALEEAFLYAGVRYQVLGTKFFERREVKDVLSLLRAALGLSESKELTSTNLGDLKRIINVPPRGIGKVTFLKIAEGKADELAPAMKKRVDDFSDTLARIARACREQKPSEAVKFAVQASGIETALASGDDDDLERLANIKELATLATKYDALAPPEGIEKLLEEAALATDQDALEKNEDAVKLMTIHAAKGLEFDYVFITGLEEGLFPYESADRDSARDEEEERRLFYVALTRARKRLFLTHTSIRTIFGSEQVNIPSQFISDIDEGYVSFEEGGAMTSTETSYLDDIQL